MRFLSLHDRLNTQRETLVVGPVLIFSSSFDVSFSYDSLFYGSEPKELVAEIMCGFI